MPTVPAPADPVREAALDWFVRRQAPAFGPADEAAFQRWLAADASHRAAFAAWEKEWQALDTLSADDRAWLAQSDLTLAAGKRDEGGSWPAGGGLPADGSRPRARPFLPARRRLAMPALAAAGALAVSAGAGLLGWQYWLATPRFRREYSTRRGQFLELPLTDGSRLTLDTATRIEVSFYPRRREVRLIEGQAVFAVEADPARPFIVAAGPLQVTVVGTRFSVRRTPGLPGDPAATVAVEEGRVRVGGEAGPDRGQGLLLSAGDQISCDAEGRWSEVVAVGKGGIAPWRQYRVAFDNQRLDQALAELGRYRDLALVVRDPRVAALEITGVFDPRDLATFRRILPLSLPVRLQDSGSGPIEIVMAR